jgi:hypothetical protein
MRPWDNITPIDPAIPLFFHRSLTIDPFSGPLSVYGYHSPSTYPEDKANERRLWTMRHSFSAVCFSEVVPEGEYGLVPYDDVTEISEADFEIVWKALGNHEGEPSLRNSFSVIDGSLRARFDR